MSSAMIRSCIIQKLIQRVPCVKSGMFWFPMDRYSQFKNHSVELELVMLDNIFRKKVFRQSRF